MLGEQNELTQELASQGMSIVYELGDASMKKSLVDALVSTLTGSGKRKRAIKVKASDLTFLLLYICNSEIFESQIWSFKHIVGRGL